MKTKAILITLIVMLAITAYVFQSCKKDANNLPPEVPDEDYPIDDSKIFGLEGNLDWGCSDPENDPLTYDLYFGTSSNPELKQPGISDSLYKVGTLIEDTTYYWKIVAKDNKGNVTESPVWDFSTQANGGYGTMYDSRDGKTYKTVVIGGQEWMAENLNFANIPSSCYDDDPWYCDIYGSLYKWEHAQNACPEGWHLPSDRDWFLLVEYLGGAEIAGGKLKATGTIEDDTGLWAEPNTGATNESGFTALPGGYKNTDYNGFYWLKDFEGAWWTSDLSAAGCDPSSWIWYQGVNNWESEFLDLCVHRDAMLSVRCLKD